MKNQLEKKRVWLAAIILSTCVLMGWSVCSAGAAVAPPIRGWVTLYDSGVRAHEEHQYKAAEQTLRSALDAAEGDDRKTIITLESLERLYDDMGDYDAAQGVLLQLLQVLVEANFPQDEQARVYLKLGALHSNQQNLEKAESCFKKTLHLLQAADGNVSADIAILLNNLGWVEQQRGKLSAAELHFKEALSLLKTSPGEKSVKYGLTASNLAEVYVAQSRTAEALRWLKEASAALCQSLGKNDPVAKAVENRYQSLLKKASSYRHVRNRQGSK